MENEQLRTAITRAGLTLEEFADIVQVDVKTVQRWIAGRATPYRRNRASVASALDTTERALWPDAVPAPATPVAREPATDEPSDVIAGYAFSSDPRAPNAAELLGTAVERIAILMPGPVFPPGVVELLRARAADGCDISIIIDEPDLRVEALLDIDAIEIRAPRAGAAHTLYRADDEILLALRHVSFPDQSPPLIHLRRVTPGALFDRFTHDFNHRWDEATPLTSREQIPAYPGGADLGPWTESAQLPEADPPPAPKASAPVTPAVSPADAPRRWPRRPT